MAKAKARLARFAYSRLLGALTPAYVARLWWRGRQEPLYRHAVAERLGFHRGPASSGCVWIHAVSLGETRAAASLVDALRVEMPSMRLLLTHGTATGREAGSKMLRPGDHQTWLPWDTPGAVRRFFGRFEPAVGVLMETEIWPNLLEGAAATGVPMVLANARLSERSLRKGRRFEALLRPAVASLSLVLAQTQADAQRLRIAGATEIEVCGNLKYDVAPDPALLERGRAWRRARPVVLAASTREGEEGPVLDAWLALAAPRPLLLVVPRHPQRFDEVAAAIEERGLSLARRSAFGDAPAEGAFEVDAWLGDSLGEMPMYYALADIALLGGSFEPLGGQNLIEAAACGCPLVMGPHTFNFAEAAQLSVSAGASRQVRNVGEAVATAIDLIGNPIRDEMARAALDFAAMHRGAAARMARRIAGMAASRTSGGSALATRRAAT